MPTKPVPPPPRGHPNDRTPPCLAQMEFLKYMELEQSD